MKADVAIIIVTYNSQGQIRECLESVFKEQKDVLQQVIVVDNQSRDGTVELVRAQFPEVQLILPDENLGFAKGVNLGARHADADFILLLNPDTVILDHAVDVIVNFARAHPHYGLYGGRTLKPDGTLEPSSCWGVPTLWSMTMFAFGITTLASNNRWLNPESLGSWKRDSVREVGVITGCFLLTTIDLWRELKGLDERYFMYGEDVDFAIRAKASGCRPVICPDAKLVHEVGQSSDTPLHKILLLYRGKASLVRSHWKGLAKTTALFLLAAGTALRAAAAGFCYRSSGDSRWKTLWQKRHEWLQGY